MWENLHFLSIRNNFIFVTSYLKSLAAFFHAHYGHIGEALLICRGLDHCPARRRRVGQKCQNEDLVQTVYFVQTSSLRQCAITKAQRLLDVIGDRFLYRVEIALFCLPLLRHFIICMHHHVMDQNDRKEQRLVLLDSRAQVEIDKLKQQLAKSDKQGSSSKKRPQVLEEDEYTSRIEAIIERDFFPDVTKLKFELEYQDALEKNDFDKLQQLGKQKFELSQHSTVVHTPATFETPLQLSREIETEPTITLPRLV